MKRINQRDFTDGYHDPYSTFRRNMNMNDDRTKTSGHIKNIIPIWGDGERMTKLTKLIEYMEAHNLETIDLDNAASVMTSKNDYAYNLLNKCGRFERVGRGVYKLLPKKAKEGEEIAQPAPQPDAQPPVPIQAPKAQEVPYMTKPQRIIEFMERKGWTEISVASAANLIGLSVKGTYPHLCQSKRFELCGRGKYRLLPDPDKTNTPAPAPEPEQEPEQDEDSSFRPAIDLDERMARYKQEQAEPVTPEEQPAVQHPDRQEEIPGDEQKEEEHDEQEDTTAQEDKMKLIKDGKLSIPAGMTERAKEERNDWEAKEQKERMSIKEIIADSVLITKLQEEVAGLREENERLTARLKDQGAPITQDQDALKKMYLESNQYSLTSEQPRTAQPAQEPRKVIRLCLCPHCNKQIIVD